MSAGPETVVLFLSALLMVWLFYGPWQRLCVDSARQEMFEARNALFSYAEEGLWSFQSYEYRYIRSQFEIMIRFAHRNSWPRVLFLRFLTRSQRTHPSSIAQIISSIENADLRHKVQSEFENVERAAVYLLVRRSILLNCVVFLLMIVDLCYSPFKERQRAIKHQMFSSIQQEAQTVDWATPTTTPYLTATTSGHDFD